MGNSPPSGGLLLGNGDHTYQANIKGSSVCLMFTGREVEEDEDEGEIFETWEMAYKAGMLTCEFVLSKTSGNNTSPPHDDHDDEKLEIEISDKVHRSSRFPESFKVLVERDEAGLLRYRTKWTMNFRIGDDLTTVTTNEFGVITKTSCHIYGNRNRKGLVVTEWKIKSKDRNPYMGTVTHYYVNGEKGEEAGLSVAVKRIRVLDNGEIDFSVNGPEQHPVDALNYMFNQVLRTRTWKHTYCPHCAYQYINERLSDTDTDTDTESESDTDNIPTPPPTHDGHRNSGGSLLINDGRYKGKNNGNTYIKNLLIGGRQ